MATAIKVSLTSVKVIFKDKLDQNVHILSVESCRRSHPRQFPGITLIKIRGLRFET